ncbi:MAG: carboxylating nicotinate-nucleotide diphosphorylase [Planctomycetaceae bacterium]|jgi:nicotinate-nucleotide pyrophosphorylase (carboxylating)|nr:carboxylating nicotinate-nucleotide diphosphorylase [Planctomycetaceae bacterium]
MSKEFYQSEWDGDVVKDFDRILLLAYEEELFGIGDLTTFALIPNGGFGGAFLAVREDAVVSGMCAIPVILNIFSDDVNLEICDGISDGKFVCGGTRLVCLTGSVRGILMAERILLNCVSRMMGVATLTRSYVEAISGTGAKIYDTRKTTLGLRRLEKYAVKCGGGQNHRMGLFDAVLIKDNHLAFGKEQKLYNPASAVIKSREYLLKKYGQEKADSIIVEVEVDNLEQLAQVLVVKPDIVLLDNMSPEVLREAVVMRNNVAEGVELEASGGVKLSTVRSIAETGVERISVGALTHSATSIDVGLDWIN